MNVVRVQLPSRGYLYDGKLEGGWCEIRPMTTREEKIFLTPRQDRTKLLWKVIENCLLTKDVPVLDLLIGDKFFLLFAIRNATYGPEYNFNIVCSSCGTRIKKSLRIPEDLQMRVLEETDGPTFEIELPISKTKLALRRLTGRDEEEILRYVSSKSTNSDDGDPEYIYRLSRYIVRIDDKDVDGTAALDFCEEMTAGDSSVMREAVNEHDCGIDIMFNHICAKCGWEFDEQMPFTADFFRTSTVSHRF